MSNVHLFEPYTVRGNTFRNRVGVSPMCQYSAEDGFANDWHLVHLGSRAVGGVGLVIAEATAIEPRGRITPQDIGIWSDDHIAPLKRITQFITEQGAIAGIQLAHAGRKASSYHPWSGKSGFVPYDEGGWEVVAPSAVPFNPDATPPHQLTHDEIDSIRANFISGAKRAIKAGFTFIELHAAHGYLLNSFLSPLSNHRTDEYGGSFENRARLLAEIATETRAIMPDSDVLAVRISATDWVEGGWTGDDSVALAKLLKPLGVDIIDASSGGLDIRQKIDIKPLYQVPFASQIRREAEIATATVGLINDAHQADQIIRDGEADMVLLGRKLLNDPYWTLHAAQTLGQPAPIPSQYLRGF
jgi:2,4-dienoyl-CoA reductase-like NADH-dependent reductase (Old Yellow Enzyme family)